MGRSRKRAKTPERSPRRDQPSVTRADLEDAYQEAVRTASRSSLMGAVGFGLALLMLALLEGSLLAPEGALERFFFVGGLVGGITFSLLALRAARAARQCKEQLDRGV
jgi:hypothetical protein